MGDVNETDFVNNYTKHEKNVLAHIVCFIIQYALSEMINSSLLAIVGKALADPEVTAGAGDDSSGEQDFSGGPSGSSPLPIFGTA